MIIKKQRVWKPRLFRFGLYLTLLVMGADWIRLRFLVDFENKLYDYRARYCQHFASAPTDRIVHIDIDDDSLNEIGHWPWPRATLAQVIDEIARAKPKVIGLDMYFPEPEKDEGELQPDGSVKLIPHDDIFAASLRNAGNVLMPISVRFKQSGTTDPLQTRIEEILATNLEADPAEVVDQLKKKGLGAADVEDDVRRLLPLARKQAMMNRLTQELAGGQRDPEALAKILVPRSIESGVRTEAAKLLVTLYPEVLAIRATERFRFPLPKDVQLCDAPGEIAVNTMKFAQELRYSGFVDLPPSSSDGTVRTVPMLVNYRGGGFPHMALSMACALLDVEPRDIRCTADRIILPRPNGAPVEIPARTEQSTNLGTVGAMVDVPYFGKGGDGGWLTMYDYPHHREPTAHIKIGNFWAIIQRENSVKKNNALIDQALKTDLAGVLKDLSASDDSPEFAKYISTRLDPADAKTRLDAAEAVVKLLQANVPDLFKPDSEIDDADIRHFGTAAKKLQSLRNENGITQDALIRSRTEMQKQLLGKGAFVNWTAAGGGDKYPTSLHPNCPGALIQSTIISGILTHAMERRLPFWWTSLFTLVVGLVTTVLVALLPPWRALLFTALVMISYALFDGEILYDHAKIIVGTAGPLTICAVAWGGLTLTNFITAARERARIRKQFTSYFDPAIVSYFEEHPELDGAAGQRREMTVVFTDLAGFTTISETLGESTVNLLNEFFGKMVPVIRANNGVVNKFLGDGLMFFYNAPRDNPNHAADAVRSVLEMRKVLEAFNITINERGLPSVGMRAGMTTGPMIVGDAGSKSEDEKNNANDYTVLGDKVNLAARLEGANKVFGSDLMMNQETRDAIGDKFLCRKIGKIQVKGKSEFVMCHEAICKLSEATPQQLAHADLSTRIVDTFQKGEFERCLAMCDQLEAEFGDAEFAEAYRDECTMHLEKAFKGEFNGQIVLSQK